LVQQLPPAGADRPRAAGRSRSGLLPGAGGAHPNRRLTQMKQPPRKSVRFMVYGAAATLFALAPTRAFGAERAASVEDVKGEAFAESAAVQPWGCAANASKRIEVRSPASRLGVAQFE